MPGQKRKRHARRGLPPVDVDALQSIQRDDGLWESIEHDEEALLDSEHDAVALVGHHVQDTRRSTSPRNVQPNSPAPPTGPTDHRLPSAAREVTIVQRRRGRPPKKKFREAQLPAKVNDPLEVAIPSPPKRSNQPSVHRRHVRFSDPDPSDAGRSRASHVFVRLHKVLVSTDGDHPNNAPASTASCSRRLEFVWNNRAKAWKLSGDRGSEGMVELHGLLEPPLERLEILRAFVSPTEHNGVRQPLEMVWDPATFCFNGLNQDNEAISVTLGEMKDMARDPWRRQYVGYILS